MAIAPSFLPENPRLARACAAAGIVFIGPSADVLEAAGDKLAARTTRSPRACRCCPAGGARPRRGRGGWPRDRLAGAGQGGRRRRRPGPAAGQPAGRAGRGGHGAIAEAQAAFGDPRVYLERFVAPARHVEVQLLGDGETVIHLGDRDCSVQRRYQKLVEEAPAPQLGEALRVGMRAAAVALGLHLRYQGLGTAEFLVDSDRGAFYFLEMNARIQVEHPVTEAVCGLDLVAEQIAIAEGARSG